VSRRSSVRSEIFVATRATPFPSPVGAAYSAVAAVCDRLSFITFLSSVIDRRYNVSRLRIPTGFQSISPGLASASAGKERLLWETVPTNSSTLKAPRFTPMTAGGNAI